MEASNLEKKKFLVHQPQKIGYEILFFSSFSSKSNLILPIFGVRGERTVAYIVSGSGFRAARLVADQESEPSRVGRCVFFLDLKRKKS